MNGKESKDLSESLENQIFFSKEKETKLKRDLHVKYITLLVLSNVFLLLLTSPPTQETVTEITTPTPAKNHKYLSLPLKLFVPLNDESKTSVSLYDEFNNQVVKKAYINKKSDRDISFGSEDNYYDVEISENDLEAIIKLKGQTLHALPESKPVNKRRIQYEIIF